jgi:peptide/nickel transport system permease protein
MKRYIIKRTLMVMLITLGVTFIVFGVMNVIPGDPGRLILGMGATAEDVAGLNHELGVDRPFFLRYITYLANALRGDFGTSYHSRRPVAENIKTALP